MRVILLTMYPAPFRLGRVYENHMIRGESLAEEEGMC